MNAWKEHTKVMKINSPTLHAINKDRQKENRREPCMNASGKAKHTSKVIQNEALDCLARMLCSNIIKEIQVFCVLADEMKNHSKKSFLLRYYYDGAARESLDFRQADKLDAAGLTNMIICSLERYDYYRASVMSGKHSGVSARIEEAKYAFNVHFSAHCLNLVLVDARASVREAFLLFINVQLICVPEVDKRSVGDVQRPAQGSEGSQLDAT